MKLGRFEISMILAISIGFLIGTLIKNFKLALLVSIVVFTISAFRIK